MMMMMMMMMIGTTHYAGCLRTHYVDTERQTDGRYLVSHAMFSAKCTPTTKFLLYSGVDGSILVA